MLKFELRDHGKPSCFPSVTLIELFKVTPSYALAVALKYKSMKTNEFWHV